MKRDCWNQFLQEVKENNIWTATGYTLPRIDKTGQILVSEDRTVVESHYDREQAILHVHFPKAPPGSYEPQEGGLAFQQVNIQLIGALLGKAANTSAPGDGRISADIIKIFWQWDCGTNSG